MNADFRKVTVNASYVELMRRQWADTEAGDIYDQPDDEPLLRPMSALAALAKVALVLVFVAAFAVIATWPTLANIFNRIFN